MISRPFWQQRIEDAWIVAPIVWLAGVRRSGKTTLAGSLGADRFLYPDTRGAPLMPSGRVGFPSTHWLYMGNGDSEPDPAPAGGDSLTDSLDFIRQIAAP